MDLYCQRCEEPYDLYHISHDMDQELEDYGPNGEKPSERFKLGEGCPCCDWGKEAPEETSFRAEAQRLAMDMLGDDLDGVASLMDDFEHMGYS